MLFGEVSSESKFEIGGAPFGEVVLIGNGNDDAFHSRRFGGDQAVE